MRSWLHLFGTSMVGIGMCSFIGTVYAATPTGRADYSNVSQLNRAVATTAASSQRMPTMPTLPNFTVGNTSPDLPLNNPDNPDNPDEPDQPDDPDQPTSECPDGGVKDSEYTIDNCMNDVLNCVNTGALPNGINDLFNEDLRNSIINGMNLCMTQVEKCVVEVRKNCSNVYRTATDVWIDFNSRKVQPTYYNFVLRKTGLTPNQAENTCLLLDVNTYGSSFDAVSNSGNVTAEYNVGVGAYNSQNGNVLIKNNPQGAELNYGNSGVDGQRGHYARWDPTTADCWIRVAAYNKDSQIKNSWLFGAAGDDQPAEVWKLAGDTFTCNRDLFGFSLMNKTSTAAVVGIGGGALVGAGVGAIAGHGARAFDCDNEKHRELLTEELRANASFGYVSNYIVTPISANVDVITKSQCEEIVNLYDNYVQLENKISQGKVTETTEETIIISEGYNQEELTSLLNQYGLNGLSISCETGNNNSCNVDTSKLKKVFTTDIEDLLRNGEASNIGKSIAIGAGVGVGAGGLATAITAFVERSNINCRVGDGLAQVGYGKSYSIEKLKDFYVKWNLNLPDTITPTGTAVDCQSWKRACSTIEDLNQCAEAQLNYKPAGASSITLIPNACAVSGSACIENYPVARSYGACE